MFLHYFPLSKYWQEHIGNCKQAIYPREYFIKQKNILTILALLLFPLLQAQDFNALKKRLKTETDRQKIETYLDISEQPISRDTALVYLNKALETAKKIHFDSIYSIIFAKSAAYYLKSDFVKAKKEIRKGFKVYKYTKNPDRTLAHINMLLGVFNESVNQKDSAKYYYEKTITKWGNILNGKDKSIIASTLINYGNIFMKEGNYLTAIDKYIQATKILDKLNDNKSKVQVLNNIAGCYKEMDNYNKAGEYYKRAINIAEKNNDKENIGALYIGIGEVTMINKDYKNALDYYKKAEKILQKIGYKELLLTVYQTLAQLYFETNDLDNAEKYITKSINGLSEFPDSFILVNALITKSNIYYKKNKLEQSLSSVNKAYAMAKTNKYLKLEKDAIEQKIQVLKKLKKYDQLIPLFDNLVVVKDSLLNKENLKNIQKLETKYQTAKKEKENALLKKQKAEQELEIARRKRQNLIYAGGLGVSLLSLGIFFFFYRRNAKQKQMILELQRELHHRIKNNLRVITAFINSIKEKFENKEKVDVQEVNEQLNELEKRVQTIYNLHKQLYEGAKVTHLDLDKYIKLLTETIAANYDQAVETELDIPEGTSIKADNSIILGLILTELTINAFKHAFRKAGGRIKIKIRDLGKQLQIVFSDNGPGLPEDLDIKNLDSFGMRIVRNMTKQMDGELKMKNENGLTYEIIIPK